MYHGTVYGVFGFALVLQDHLHQYVFLDSLFLIIPESSRKQLEQNILLSPRTIPTHQKHNIFVDRIFIHTFNYCCYR